MRLPLSLVKDIGADGPIADDPQTEHNLQLSSKKRSLLLIHYKSLDDKYCIHQGYLGRKNIRPIVKKDKQTA